MLVTAQQTIEAIQTPYRGYYTRSRLEARTMVLLDTLGVRFAYEKEAYVLADGVCYLPDLWLDAQGLWPEPSWIELKGRLPTREELRKCILLARLTGCPVYLLWEGDYGWTAAERHRRYGYDGGLLLRPDWSFDLHQWFYDCAPCGRVGLSAYGVCPCGNAQAAASTRLVAAYAKAGRYRFERKEDAQTLQAQKTQLRPVQTAQDGLGEALETARTVTEAAL